ncbi:hypothetical protein NKK48_01140 [Mesorhizobium sp. C386A]|uniref:hypothetical protein n=1 Tax=Mesorhizobium sp. C386A TaxID=2956831 RepID=UPI0033380EBA
MEAEIVEAKAARVRDEAWKNDTSKMILRLIAEVSNGTSVNLEVLAHLTDPTAIPISASLALQADAEIVTDVEKPRRRGPRKSSDILADHLQERYKCADPSHVAGALTAFRTLASGEYRRTALKPDQATRLSRRTPTSLRHVTRSPTDLNTSRAQHWRRSTKLIVIIRMWMSSSTQ